MAPRMPERYHYSSSRLAPIWVIPRMNNGPVDNGSLMSIGSSFLKGPLLRVREQKESHETEEYVLPPFQNVELYNLVVRRLGVEKWASETNGTKGFWDRSINAVTFSGFLVLTD
ncbi:hypothetical protein JVT61DRAFT_6519 [Boletus reticuloceps]|uniref:Uncharacterized protein n=1 Tax=Boletus reticuloceps TaxID=495285 RepID=A0A8I2YL19_9AGAM|nr:hypothetical protein JVT61DRAFT_6519 [Boletus reticuloceps]